MPENQESKTPKGHEIEPAESDEEQIEPLNIWDAVQHPKIAAGIERVLISVSQAIEEWTKNEPKKFQVHFRVTLLSYIFGLLIFIGIGFLGWLGILSHETTATLLAALIGYWYGQREKQQKQ